MDTETAAGSESDRLMRVEQRTAVLRGQLSGPVDGQAGRRSVERLRRSREANVLVAAALHGAARRRLGLELTGLEQRLTDTLVALFGEEQVAQFGQVYQEPASRAGVAELFPEVVVGRAVEQGFGWEDLRAWLPSAAPAIAELPTVRTLTVEQLQQGALTGQEEAVTVLATPGRGQVAADPIHETRIRLVQFRCDRESGEAGKDEVYWGTGAASEAQAEIVVVGRVYGSISTGTVTRFDGDSWFFKGPAEDWVVGHLQCWESDPGGNDFNAMRQMLGATARESAWAAAEAALQGDLTGAIAEALTAAVTGLVNWLLGFNKDDFIHDMTVAWSRAALDEMARTNQGRSDLVFDGGSDGKHTLTIQVTQGPVIAAALWHSIYFAGKWSRPVEIPQLVSGSKRPSAAIVRKAMPEEIERDILVVAYRRYDSVVEIGTYDGETWSTPRPLLRDGSPLKSGLDPRIAVSGGKIYLNWYAASAVSGYYRIWTSPIDLDTATAVGPVAEVYTRAEVTSQGELVDLSGKLTFIGNDSHPMSPIEFYVYDTAAGKWNEENSVPYRGSSGFAAAVFGGWEWVFFFGKPRNDDPHLFRTFRRPVGGGRTWQNYDPPFDNITKLLTNLPPSATVHTEGIDKSVTRLLLTTPTQFSAGPVAVWDFDGSNWTKGEHPAISAMTAWPPYITSYAGGLHMLFTKHATA